MSHGRVIEQGTHNELLKKQSMYYELVKKQRMSTERSTVINKTTSALNGDVDVPGHDGLSGSKPDTKESNEYTRGIMENRVAERDQGNLAQDFNSSRYSLWELIKFVARINKQETLIMLSGLFWSIITGAGNPVYGPLPSHDV